MTDSEACVCPAGTKYCERHGRKINEQLRALCGRDPQMLSAQTLPLVESIAPPANRLLERLACPHRGEVLRQVGCPDCRGNDSQVEVYACALHQECSLQDKGIRLGDDPEAAPVKACIVCDDRPVGLAAAVSGPPPAGGPQRAGAADASRSRPKRILNKSRNSPAADAVPLELLCPWAPGDNVVATAVVRDLAFRCRGRYRVTVRTYYPEIWEHNPHVAEVLYPDQVSTLEAAGEPVRVELSPQAALDKSGHRSRHYIEAYHEQLAGVLKLPELEITRFAGDVHPVLPLAGKELVTRGDRPLIVITAGGKLDGTCKLWPVEHWLELIWKLLEFADIAQVGARDLDSGGHIQPKLKPFEALAALGRVPPGVFTDLRGQTSHRDLIDLVTNCDGVICGNSYLMHLAAAVPSPKPAIVLAGGREPVSWYQYPGHQVLHTIGELDCCARVGCWKDRVVAIGDGRIYDDPKKLCKRPVGTVAECMARITPDSVIQLARRIFPSHV